MVSDGRASKSNNVVDLDSRRRDDVVPTELWAEVEAAATLWEEMQISGREVRFELPGAPARVRAELREIGGGTVRQLPLRDIVPDGDGPPAAA